MDVIPDVTAEYSTASYWETRFETEQEHEWFSDYRTFRHLLAPRIPLPARILILGNGTSRLPYDLLHDGWQDITVTDICRNLIQKLSNQGLLFQVADMCDLPFGDGAFDVVIEKGALDVLFTDARSPWEPPPSVCQRMETACKEIHRVLQLDGHFFSITFTQPRFRTRFFSRNEWNCQVDRFGEEGSLEYFVYHLHKTGTTTSTDPGPTPTDKWSPAEDPMHTHLDDIEFLSCIDL